MADSTELRRRCRSARRAIGIEQRAAADRQIASALLEVLATVAPGAFATYLPTDGEVDPSAAVERLRAAGWRAHLPVLGEDTAMDVAPWPGGAELAPNRFGVAEPVDRHGAAPADTMAVVLVPCVAVDTAGNRLGFGKGYYDRALASATDTLKIGLAYDVQVVEHIDAMPWDVRLDLVLTGTRRIDLRR